MNEFELLFTRAKTYDTLLIMVNGAMRKRLPFVYDPALESFKVAAERHRKSGNHLASQILTAAAARHEILKSRD